MPHRTDRCKMGSLNKLCDIESIPLVTHQILNSSVRILENSFISYPELMFKCVLTTERRVHY